MLHKTRACGFETRGFCCFFPCISNNPDVATPRTQGLITLKKIEKKKCIFTYYTRILGKPQTSHAELGLRTGEIRSTQNACSLLLPGMSPNTEQTCLGIKTYHAASGEAPKLKKIEKNGQNVHFGVSILHFVHRKSVCRPNRPQNPAS